MGSACTSLIRAGTLSEKEKMIQRELNMKRKKDSAEVKVLLLGTGDSGKSTIFKQFRLLYGKTAETRVDASTLIESTRPCFTNVVEGAKAIVTALDDPELNLPQLMSSRAIEAMKVIRESSLELGYLDAEMADAIYKIYTDEAFQSIWKKRSAIQILDSWTYFADKCGSFPKWGGPEWHPNESEYLLIRNRTTGMIQAKFKIEDATFLLVDVGGQKSERKKWASAFVGVGCVIFVTASSEYDQVLFEDNTINRLKESLHVFSNIAMSDVFSDTTIILFLNKSDLFKQKLCELNIPINVTRLFPDAPTSFDYEQGMTYIKGLFKAQIQEAVDERKKFAGDTKTIKLDSTFFVHVTTAIDTNKARVVLEATKTTVLKRVFENMRLPM